MIRFQEVLFKLIEGNILFHKLSLFFTKSPKQALWLNGLKINLTDNSKYYELTDTNNLFTIGSKYL